LDLTAGDGEGIGSLYFKNLTDGDTAFHTVSGMINRPLGLVLSACATARAAVNLMPFPGSQ
jgi:hypothetical protein